MGVNGFHSVRMNATWEGIASGVGECVHGQCSTSHWQSSLRVLDQRSLGTLKMHLRLLHNSHMLLAVKKATNFFNYSYTRLHATFLLLTPPSINAVSRKPVTWSLPQQGVRHLNA